MKQRVVGESQQSYPFKKAQGQKKLIDDMYDTLLSASSEVAGSRLEGGLQQYLLEPITDGLMGKLLERWKQNEKRDEDTERIESDSEEREGMASEERQGHVTLPKDFEILLMELCSSTY
ncbi:unnamed protein product [Leuciscus chuanchicus]